MNNQKLESEKVILSAPTSFSGSRARIWKMTQIESDWLRWLIAIPTAFVFVLVAWCLVLVWYLLWGIWLIPWRIFRRSHRKEKKRELQHRELLEQLQSKQAND